MKVNEIPPVSPLLGVESGLLNQVSGDTLIELLPAALYLCDAQGAVTRFNRKAAELWQEACAPSASAGIPVGNCPSALAEATIPPLSDLVRTIVQDDVGLRNRELIVAPSGKHAFDLSVDADPVRDANGSVIGVLCCLRKVDNTDRRKAEEYAQRLTSIVENSDDAIVAKNIDGIITSWNHGAERLFGYRADEAIGQPIRMLIPADRVDEAPGILDRIRAGERIDHYETVRRRKDGVLIDISLTVSPVVNASGQIIGASKIARDITARKRAEDRRRLLINELNHRVKNTLATVQSISALTLGKAQQPETLEAFQERLMALSRAHNVLTAESWESADIGEIVREAVAPLRSTTDDRFHISGPLVRLKPQAALSLALALHELCTNAAKYGAFSNSSGRVSLLWWITDSPPGPTLNLEWAETGGPSVSMPTRRGFGSRMIERVLVNDLCASVRLNYLPQGVRCHIAFPQDDIGTPSVGQT